MMLASPAAAGAIHVAPVYRKDVKRPADADLRRVCSLTRSLLPSDGVELPFENMALLNTPRIRSVVLSEMWVHATHERALRFFVHAVAAPEDASTERAVAYVCLGPRAFASTGVLRRRKRAYEEGMSGTHWPHHCVDRGEERGPPRRYADAAAEVRRLVDGDGLRKV